MKAATVHSSALASTIADHLAWLATHGYAKTTVSIRAHHLRGLADFLSAYGVTDVATVTLSALDSYQRHLFAHRKVNGEPLSFRTQAQRLVSTKVFFAWCAKSGVIPFDPSAGIVLPKAERRLPESTLTKGEVETVLAGPDTTTALGIRDRAILEVFYSKAIRRAELISLHTWDIDAMRGTLFVRQGKGARDRHVPIGSRALEWIDRYTSVVRPRLATAPDRGVLFLSATGENLCADWLSKAARAYICAGAPNKKGSCHLFRHTAATLMLEGGADIRYVAEMLGHAKLETTQLYTRVSIDKLREVHATCHPAGG